MRGARDRVTKHALDGGPGGDGGRGPDRDMGPPNDRPDLVEPPPASTADGGTALVDPTSGCNCRLAGRGVSGLPFLMLGLLAPVIRRRRRRG